MPKRKNKNKRSVLNLIIFLAVTIGISIIALAVMAKVLFTKCPYFNISKVTIKEIGGNLYNGLDKDFSKSIIRKNIFLVNLIDLKNKIEKESKDTECVSIQRRLPSELVIFLRERFAIAQLKALRFYRIDASGAIMDGASDIAFSDLPIITGLEDIIKIKDNKDFSFTKLKSAIELIQEKNNLTSLSKYGIAKINIAKDKVSSFFIVKDFVFETDISKKNIPVSTIEVKFDLDNPRETIRVLGLLLNKYNDKLEDIEYIDLKNLNSPAVLEKKTEKKT